MNHKTKNGRKIVLIKRSSKHLVDLNMSNLESRQIPIGITVLVEAKPSKSVVINLLGELIGIVKPTHKKRIISAQEKLETSLDLN